MSSTTRFVDMQNYISPFRYSDPINNLILETMKQALYSWVSAEESRKAKFQGVWEVYDEKVLKEYSQDRNGNQIEMRTATLSVVKYGKHVEDGVQSHMFEWTVRVNGNNIISLDEPQLVQ
ncbi:hypothetical protein SCHPADRAFT_896546 [Schizopora paradoxa]|uniref:Uncharacterized protein n=1 Tax=Schizopora paradoxa TaxID=27342 RepID=A0A0H2RJW7_9AGAM|nr:hypothetical protein SCHPADRAFT_896546 [Schizopora paradoxa]